MSDDISFAPERHLGVTLHMWWMALDENRANRAMLRRCKTLDDVALCPAYQRFHRLMQAHGWPKDAPEWQNDKLAAIAALLALVKAESEQLLPASMSGIDVDKPLVSELRFRGLLKLEHTEELFQGLRRVLPLLSYKVNVHALADDVYQWSDRTRKTWAYGYRWPN